MHSQCIWSQAGSQTYMVLYQVTVAIITSYQSEILEIFNCIGITLISYVGFKLLCLTWLQDFPNDSQGSCARRQSNIAECDKYKNDLQNSQARTQEQKRVQKVSQTDSNWPGTGGSVEGKTRMESQPQQWNPVKDRREWKGTRLQALSQSRFL